MRDARVFRRTVRRAEQQRQDSAPQWSSAGYYASAGGAGPGGPGGV